MTAVIDRGRSHARADFLTHPQTTDRLAQSAEMRKALRAAIVPTKTPRNPSYNRPNSNRMTIISMIRPSPPLG